MGRMRYLQSCGGMPVRIYLAGKDRGEASALIVYPRGAGAMLL